MPEGALFFFSEMLNSVPARMPEAHDGCLLQKHLVTKMSDCHVDTHDQQHVDGRPVVGSTFQQKT